MRKIIIAILFFSINSVCAQKLPNVQKASLRAPANVKVDGKSNEWGKLQAYNSAIGCEYTMANDDKKLYLVVKASGNVIINIINGGIKLSVNKTGSHVPFVKFPYMVKGKTVILAPKDWVHSDPDTVMMMDNKKLTSSIKWIYTSGIKGVDSLISIYNDKGIEAANAVDNNRLYTWELSVDLSLFGLSIENSEKFSYHITLNGEPNRYTQDGLVDNVKRILMQNNRDGSLTPDKLSSIGTNLQQGINMSTAATDFWGDYTLAK